MERDLGVTSAEYLADGAAARVAAGVLADLEDSGVAVEAAVFDSDDQSLGVHVTDEADVAAVEATGAVVLDEKPAEPDLPDRIEAYDDLKGGYGLHLTRCGDRQGIGGARAPANL